MEPDLDVSWSEYPNEEFFIRKFESNSQITGRQLRLEEIEIFKESVSTSKSSHHLHVRDYHRLCRGEKIVSTNISFTDTVNSQK